MFDSQVIPDNPILQRLRENIFDLPYASQGKDNEGIYMPAYKLPKRIALTLPAIQLNGPWCKRYMVFDLDRPLAGLAWEEANLPIPTMVVTNPKNGHAHLVYEIAKPVWFQRPDDDSPTPRPIRYWKAVYEAMGRALRADTGYTGLLTKNPLHPSWLVSYGPVKPYTLGDLAAHLDLTHSWCRKAPVEVEGRRATLFEQSRRFAYGEKERHLTLESFHQAVMHELHQINSAFSKGPEAFSVIRSTAKSVAQWTWKNYDRICYLKDRGVMKLDSSLPLSVRQQLGQGYTCRQREGKTLGRIRAAVISTLQKVGKVTKAGIARVCNLHRNTVHGYWSQVTDLLTGSQTGTVTDMVTVEGDSKVTTLREETECLRHESLVAPAGQEPAGIPDRHPTVHSSRPLVQWLQQRGLKILKHARMRVVDRIHEQRATERTDGRISTA